MPWGQQKHILRHFSCKVKTLFPKSRYSPRGHIHDKFWYFYRGLAMLIFIDLIKITWVYLFFILICDINLRCLVYPLIFVETILGLLSRVSYYYRTFMETFSWISRISILNHSLKRIPTIIIISHIIWIFSIMVELSLWPSSLYLTDFQFYY